MSFPVPRLPQARAPMPAPVAHSSPRAAPDSSDADV